jgi:hypothetical protein
MARPLISLKIFCGTHLGLWNAVDKFIANIFFQILTMNTSNSSIARRIAGFSLLALTVAIAHAGGISTTPAVMTRTSAPVMTSTPPVLQLAPPDLAMVALTPSKTTVNRMETFKLNYSIKNVSNKPVPNARIRVTADYYQLNDLVSVGALAAGEQKTGTIDITVMKDSMMGKPAEPYPVHIKFTGTAQIVGANNGATPDLNPANDQITTVTVTANPG